MNFIELKKVHFVGLGGIGVSAVARLFLFRGASVSGSDVNESEIIKALKKEGVLFFLGHKKENLAKDVELLIYSPAVSKNNPER
ncbi:MAG: UDP-N-acetylmuramate--L-alanine ligase, partial [Candidatus Portnoybacteria bacterium CG10_big_fil_rev_8_21_14_0_10_36_7]